MTVRINGREILTPQEKRAGMIPVYFYKRRGIPAILFRRDPVKVLAHWEPGKKDAEGNQLVVIYGPVRCISLARGCPYCRAGLIPTEFNVMPFFFPTLRQVMVMHVQNNEYQADLYEQLERFRTTLDFSKEMLLVSHGVDSWGWSLEPAARLSPTRGQDGIRHFLEKYNANNPSRKSPELDQALTETVPEWSPEDLIAVVPWLHDS